MDAARMQSILEAVNCIGAQYELDPAENTTSFGQTLHIHLLTTIVKGEEFSKEASIPINVAIDEALSVLTGLVREDVVDSERIDRQKAINGDQFELLKIATLLVWQAFPYLTMANEEPKFISSMSRDAQHQLDIACRWLEQPDLWPEDYHWLAVFVVDEGTATAANQQTTNWSKEDILEADGEGKIVLSPLQSTPHRSSTSNWSKSGAKTAPSRRHIRHQMVHNESGAAGDCEQSSTLDSPLLALANSPTVRDKRMLRENAKELRRVRKVAAEWEGKCYEAQRELSDFKQSSDAQFAALSHKYHQAQERSAATSFYATEIDALKRQLAQKDSELSRILDERNKLSNDLREYRLKQEGLRFDHAKEVAALRRDYELLHTTHRQLKDKLTEFEQLKEHHMQIAAELDLNTRELDAMKRRRAEDTGEFEQMRQKMKEDVQMKEAEYEDHLAVEMEVKGRLETTIKELRDELEAAKRSIQAKTAGDAQVRLALVKKQEELQQEVVSLKKECRQKEDVIIERDNNVGLLQQQLDQQKAIATQQAIRSQEELDAVRLTVARLETELSESQTERKELRLRYEADIAEANATMKTLRENNVSISSKLTGLNRNIADKADQLKIQKEKENVMKGEYDTALVKIASLENHNESLQSAHDFIQSDNTSLKNENASLQSKNSFLQSKIASLQSANDTLQSDNTSLKNEKSSLRSENTSLQSATDSLQSDMASLRTENTALQIKIASLQSDNTSLTSEKSSLRSENASLQTANDSLQSDIVSLQTDNNSLRTEHTAVQSKIASCQSEITSLQDKNDSLQIDIASRQRDNSSLRSENAALQSKITSLLSDIASLQNDNTTIQSENECLQADVTKKERNLAVVESSLETAQQEAAAVHEQLTQTECLNAELQKKLDAATLDLTVASTEYDRKLEELRGLADATDARLKQATEDYRQSEVARGRVESDKRELIKELTAERATVAELRTSSLAQETAIVDARNMGDELQKRCWDLESKNTALEQHNVYMEKCVSDSNALVEQTFELVNRVQVKVPEETSEVTTPKTERGSIGSNRRSSLTSISSTYRYEEANRPGLVEIEEEAIVLEQSTLLRAPAVSSSALLPREYREVAVAAPSDGIPSMVTRATSVASFNDSLSSIFKRPSSPRASTIRRNKSVDDMLFERPDEDSPPDMSKTISAERLRELNSRNAMQPLSLKSSYAVETMAVGGLNELALQHAPADQYEPPPLDDVFKDDFATPAASANKKAKRKTTKKNMHLATENKENRSASKSPLGRTRTFFRKALKSIGRSPVRRRHSRSMTDFPENATSRHVAPGGVKFEVVSDDDEC